MNLPSILQKAVTERSLMISVSGVRAVLPVGLDPRSLAAIGQAFADTTGRKIVTGRDSRPTGRLISDFMRMILEYRGKSVIDIGLAPTPTVKAVVSRLKADGGLIVTASHNPEEWNGLKFLAKGGFFYDQSAIQTLLDAIQNPAETSARVVPNHSMKLGETEGMDGVQLHIDEILRAIPNVQQIRRKKYCVVVDAVSGAGREALPALLERLGCRVLRMNCEPAVRFPRPPEPTPAALREFGKAVKKEGAAAGFALDPDADRLVTGSPAIGAVHEEYTLPLAFVGKAPTLKGKKRLVVNLSTATLLDAVAGPHIVERSPVGEANVVGQMRKIRAAFGGEGNGGVIDPDVPSYGRDSLTGSAWILSAMAARNATTLDELLSGMPRLFMSKEKLPNHGDPAAALARFEETAKKIPNRSLKTVTRSDGLHLLFADGSWAHLRASNTEPILRLILQANSQNDLEDLSRVFHHSEQ